MSLFQSGGVTALKNLYNYKSYLFNTATTPSVDIATNIMQLIIKSNIKLEHSTLHTKLYSLKKAIRNIPTNGHIKPI